MSPRREPPSQQRELLLLNPEWEGIVTEAHRRNLRDRLVEMLRAYFREALNREREITDAGREDSSGP